MALLFQKLATEDVELWVVRGERWQIPVLIDRGTVNGLVGWVEVSQALPANVSGKWEVLEETLSPIAANSEEQTWIIPATAFEKVAFKAPGISPDFYVKWDGESCERGDIGTKSFEARVMPASPKECADDFLRYIRAQRPEISLHDLRLVWEMIVGALPGWFLEKQRCLNFGYVILCAVPYRGNWRQILLRKFPDIARIFRMSKDNRDANLQLSDYSVQLRNTDLVEYHEKHRTFGWSIQAVETAFWREHSQEHERRKVGHSGRTGYARRWLQIIHRLNEVINEAMAAFVFKTVYPCAAPTQGEHSGSHVLGPYTPHGRVTGTSVDVGETRVQYPDGRIAPAEPGEPAPLAVAIKELPPLPIVQLEAADLRNGRKILPEQEPGRDKENVSVGVLVCDANGGDHASQRLLGGGERT